MYNLKKLDAKMIGQRTTKEDIADAIGISVNTFNRRIRDGKLLIGDIHKTCEILRLTSSEAKEIFLAGSVA